MIEREPRLCMAVGVGSHPIGYGMVFGAAALKGECLLSQRFRRGFIIILD